MGLDRLQREIAEVRERTSAPFGVDLLTALPGGMEEQVDAIIAGGASLFFAGLGVPRAVVATCHRASPPVTNMCGNVRPAEAALDHVCAMVHAQRLEPGSPTPTRATTPPPPQP